MASHSSSSPFYEYAPSDRPPAKAAVPDLLRILQDRNDPDAERFSTRYASARALGGIRSMPASVVPALCEALCDASPNLRRGAVLALGAMSWHAKDAAAAIEGAMKDGDADFREAAKAALTAIRRPPPPSIGDQLPALELARLYGDGKRRLDEFKGSVVAIDFLHVGT